MEMRGNIRVLCRVRPPTSAAESDGSAGSDGSDQFHGGAVAVAVDRDGMTIRVTSPKTGLEKAWRFPRVFPMNEAVTQQEMFEEVEPMVQSVLDGYHATIFAYGQTGTGKTYTMTGPGYAKLKAAEGLSGEDEDGTQPRALRMLHKECTVARGERQ